MKTACSIGVFGMMALFALAACTVGPDYKRPDVADITPGHWHWRPASPGDTLPKGNWWKIFHDPVLDGLENAAAAGNQDLSAAMARVEEARAVARQSRSAFFPELSLDPSANRQRTTGHLPTPIPITVPPAYINTYSVPFDLGYEADLWGRLRRSFEAAGAQAQASAADYQNTLLTLTADVAADYFLIRSMDAEIDVLQETVKSRGESVRILKDRFDAGAIPELDLDRARSELAGAKSDLADGTRQRALTANALALLLGKPASSFSLVSGPAPSSPPLVRAGLPSTLLERRPDVARAERLLAAANARTDLARAAYFPDLRLTGQAGFLSSEAESLFSSDSRVWTIGLGVTLPIFNGGRISAEVAQARASYLEALANYRQTVLEAFKDVEDSLAEIVFLKQQAAREDDALASARKVALLAQARYDAGAVGYLDVVDAQRDVLDRERLRARLEGQRFAAGVRLIKALGGGWSAK
ncbi:MAG: efflux transporter outer membrane subunit [Nitrospiraceae bacterium]|nr:efflux transporter outer membrane subunit [Nitrospiraceae bacterium]